MFFCPTSPAVLETRPDRPIAAVGPCALACDELRRGLLESPIRARRLGAVRSRSGPIGHGRLHATDAETLTHRLILPRDANHHGTLYAGVLLSLALEAAYATAFRAAGLNANLVLKRVLDLRCYEPVPIGRVVEIRGREVHRGRAQVVVALYGSPLARPARRPGWTA